MNRKKRMKGMRKKVYSNMKNNDPKKVVFRRVLKQVEHDSNEKDFFLIENTKSVGRALRNERVESVIYTKNRGLTNGDKGYNQEKKYC